MIRDPTTEPFVLTVERAAALPGAAVLVNGPVASGILRQNEPVEVWDGDRHVLDTTAFLELASWRDAGPEDVSLRLVPADVRLLSPGHTIRSRTPRS